MPELATTFERVVRIVSNQSGRRADRITGESRIHHDLEIWGDDVPEMFWELEEEFEVKIDCSTLVYDRFFIDEGTAIVWPAFLIRANAFCNWSRIPVTVDHLLAVVEAKRWFDPDGEPV